MRSTLSTCAPPITSTETTPCRRFTPANTSSVKKPLATTSQDGEALVSEAARANREGFVPFVYRFYPSVQEMRHRIAQGDSGPIHLIHGSYLQDWLASATASNWRVNSQTGGPSRTFGDIGVHWCDLLEHVTGHKISRLFANTDTVFTERDGAEVATEDAVHIIFETDHGATGSFLASQVSLGRKKQDCPRSGWAACGLLLRSHDA